MKLVKIVTHHEDPEKAAELFAEEGVAAVGWSIVGDITRKSRDEIKRILKKQWKYSESQSAKAASQLIRLRDEVKEGDIVFAYKGNNKVALVGKVVRGYKFNDKNKIGDPKGDIGYPQQVRVEWWKNPRNFDRSFLPTKLSKWIARIGTISSCDYDINKLETILQKIPSEETVTKALEIKSEDEIKDYMEKHLGDIEEGLTFMKREYLTSSGPMDFLAKDREDIDTVIEVKMKADDSTVTQLRRYMRSYRNDSRVAKVRGIIIAEEFTKRCLDDVTELNEVGINIRLCKCKKQFGFERLL